METWGCASKSNTVITQRSQSKILTPTANSPRYVTSRTLHTDFNIPYASDVIHERINKLEAHPNPLLQPLLQPVNTYLLTYLLNYLLTYLLNYLLTYLITYLLTYLLT